MYYPMRFYHLQVGLGKLEYDIIRPLIRSTDGSTVDANNILHRLIQPADHREQLNISTAVFRTLEDTYYKNGRP